MEIKISSLSEPEQRIYRLAKELLAQNADATSFSDRLFGPQGEVSRLAKDPEDRERILRSDLYRWLKAKYTELRQQGAEEFDKELRPSSRLTVVVPRSLHLALKGEAASEGISLSELIRLKLAVPYRQMTQLLLSKKS